MTSATVHSHPAGLSPSSKHRSPSGSRESFAALLPSSSHPTKTSHDENWPPPRWRVALAACIVHGLHMGAAIIAPSVLLSPMRASLHLSVASMSLPLAALRLSSALFLLPAGTLIDRVGAARVVWPGVLLAAFCGVLAPVGVSLPHLISVQVAFAASTLLAGLTPMVVLVDAEFPHADASGSKGAAIGAVLAGFSGAGALVPPVLGAVEERFGWRAAWGAVNAVFATVGVPLTYVYLQGRGVEATAAGASCGKREAVFSRAYVTLLVMMAALAFSIHIVMDHLVVYLREDVGLSFQRSTSFMSLYHLVAVVAKLVTGRLSDAYNHRVLFGAASALGTVSCFFLVSVSSSGALTLASSEASILCFVVMCTYLVYPTAFFSIRVCISLT